MNLTWRGARGSVSLEEIHAFEQRNLIEFPKSYKALVLANNGASPDQNVFDMPSAHECVFESLINWDVSRKANIYFWTGIINSNGVIPFGKDPFGNVVCFDFTKSREPQIVMWNHETGALPFVADNFDEFISRLRS